MILLLDDETARRAELSGGKASELARLISRGHPVPQGFCVTTRAFSHFIEAADLGAKLNRIHADEAFKDFATLTQELETLQNEIRAKPLPGTLAAGIGELLTRLEASFGPETRWAVRSSAVAEDLAGASFAGQYDTILGVRGLNEVSAAILRCWASFLNPHAISYKRDRGITDMRAAVVIQRLVPAESAGVAFSVHPVTGDTGRIVINSNWGLGESVVGGLVTPDTFVVGKAGLDILDVKIGSKEIAVVPSAGCSAEVAVAPERQRAASLTADEIRRVAELVLNVEREEGRPVDVEWALSGGRVYLLQSRPVTTLKPAAKGETPAAIGTDTPGEPPEGWVPELNTPVDPRYPLFSNGNISEVLPGCITPLSWSYLGPIIDYAFRQQFRETGAMTENDPGLKAMGFFFHRPYLCVSYMAEAATRTPGVSPDRVYEEFIGKVEKPTPAFSWRDFTPAGLNRMAKGLSVMNSRRRRLDNEGRRTMEAVRQRQRETSPELLKTWSDAKLLEAVRFTPELCDPAVTHIWASTFAVVNFSMLRGLAERWLGDANGAVASQLVTGIGNLPSADPAFGIYRLSRIIAENPELSAFSAAESNPGRLYQRLTEAVTPGAVRFREALTAFLADHGHRAVCEAEFRKPCWRDDPAQVVGLIQNYLDSGGITPDEIRERQNRARTEAAAKALGALGPLKRRLFTTLLEASRHFIGLREELKNGLVLHEDSGRRIYAELGRRLLERGALASFDDLFFLVTDEVGWLIRGGITPAAAAAIIARRRREFAWCERLQVPKLQDGTPRTISEADLPAGKVLTGLGVSPGRVEGVARIILDPRQNARLKAGEILVAPVTDAGWTPLFVNAAALVVDVGGLLSHGSVVAREYGLTAVVGVTGATKRIKNGDRIAVDGDKGTVVLLD